ncbi:glycine betaine ABC transporter substrate-binding protein [Jatrophihabitans sp. YIM 134969]
MKRIHLAAAAAVSVAALALTACGSAGSSSGSTGGAGSSGDTSTVAGQLVLGGPPEFKTRSDGISGLKSKYNVTFGSFKALDAGGPLTINALKNGQIQAGDVFTTDPSIEANNFVVLEDPENLYTAQNVLPLINKEKAAQPGVTDILNKVSAALTTDDLVNLNEQVITEKKDSADVAKAWLSSKGLDASGTSAKGATLTVGSANFQENVTLANIYAQALQAQGASITTKLNIGSRETYIPGLQDGSIDLIPEYSGVLLAYFKGPEDAVSSDEVFAALPAAISATEPKLEVLEQSAAEDKDAIVVTKGTADKYGLKSIADLAKKAS